jgi:glycosyltransferase involved in cell wall biosynthesis
MRQLLIDLSVLVHKDDQSGIQRVVRSLLQALTDAPPPGCRIATVYDAGGYYAYVQDGRSADGDGGDGAPAPQAIHVQAGDIFLGLDLCPDLVPGNRAIYEDLRRHGVEIHFVVYDLLPVTMPAMFAPGASPWFTRWLETVSGVADGLLCISRAVADELLAWIEQARVPNTGALQVGYFHLGADLNADPAARLPANASVSADEAAVLAQLDGSPSFLMVGTLEPRKMHAQALDAFDLLWRQGGDAKLVIVGKPGWLTEQLAARIRRHSELGKRLFWLRHASDAALLQLYRRCAALLAASSGEGFGLPLIEAAQHGLPIVARDLQVFREVCGSHAFYFSGASAELAAALHQWLALHAQQQAPQSAGLPHLDWAASARQLQAVLLERRWYKLAPTLLT